MLSLTVDEHSPIPLYHQIAEAVRGLIETGTLHPGEQLPTEQHLSQQLGVSRLTVRQAFAELEREGRVDRLRAKGTFVSQPRREVQIVREALQSFSEEASRFGRKLRNILLAQEVGPANGVVARELDLADGAPVVLIRRIREVDGVLIGVESAHFPYDRFPELATLDLADRSLYELLDSMYHSLPYEAVDSYQADLPTALEARSLGIQRSSPVWHNRRTAWDEHGRPVEYTESAFRLDCFRYVSRKRRLRPAKPS